MTAKITLLALTLTAPLNLAIMLGCGDDGDAPPELEAAGPAVGLLELSISHRAQDPEPTNAVSIEVSPSEIRVDGNKVVDLQNGALSDSASVIAPLRAAIEGGAARSAAALKIHVNTPYGTLSRVAATLKAANINTLGFAVRPVSDPNTAGWMVIHNYAIVDSPEDAEFPNGVQRNWDEFVAGWEESYTGCRRSHYVDCSHHSQDPATGGSVRITLFSRGNALKVDFDRFGAEDEPRVAAQPAMLDGVPPVGGGVAQEVAPPPAADASFTWRFEGAVDPLSPIKDAFRPLCGARPCGVVQTGDQGTMSMRVISMLGAAFPSGTDAPHVAFVIPEP